MAILADARIFHVNVNCSDLARSRDFYVDGCGLSEGVRTVPAGSQSGAAFGLDRARWDAWILVGPSGFDGGAIDLLEWQEPRPTGRAPGAIHEAGFQRVGLVVPDLDATIASTTANGGTVWSDPLVHEVGGGKQVRVVFASDPDGTAIELFEGEVARLSFVGVACADLDRSVAFYATLGFREAARFPSSSADAAHLRVNGPLAMTEVMMVAPAGGEVSLMLVGFERPAVQPGGPRSANTLGMWRTALVLPELDRAVAVLAAAGIELLSPPQTMAMGPGLPDLRFVCLRGPDDEVIELIEQ
jgi:catechol 2,3-dioxygenase-like lactoylglutathione lyase family enzyme